MENRMDGIDAEGSLSDVSDKPDMPKLPNDGRPYLTIAVTADNNLSINGSIQDKVLAYGLLEAARDAIKSHIETQHKPSLIKPTGPSFMRQFLQNGKRI